MNGVDYTRVGALCFVGAGALYLIYCGQHTTGASLLGAILGYAFGNGTGYAAAMKALGKK